MKLTNVITYNDAKAILEGCQEHAAKAGTPSSVAVLDGAGRTVLIARADGAAWQTPEVAVGKALTSVMMRKSSKAIEEVALSRQSMLTFSDGRLPIQGALPLFADGVCVGAVGVSGGTPEQDEAQAQAGVDAFELLIKTQETQNAN